MSRRVEGRAAGFPSVYNWRPRRRLAGGSAIPRKPLDLRRIGRGSREARSPGGALLIPSVRGEHRRRSRERGHRRRRRNGERHFDAAANLQGASRLRYWDRRGSLRRRRRRRWRCVVQGAGATV